MVERRRSSTDGAGTWAKARPLDPQHVAHRRQDAWRNAPPYMIDEAFRGFGQVTAKDDQIGIEQIGRRRYGRRQMPERRVPDVGIFLHRGQQAPGMRRVDMGGAGQRALGQKRLQAARIAAGATLAILDHLDMAKLDGPVAAGTERHAVDHQTGAEAGAQIDVEQRGRVAPDAVARFRQRHRADIVLDHHRHAQRRFEFVGERHVLPVVIDRLQVAAALGVHRSRHAEPQADQARTVDSGLLDQLLDDPHHHADHRGGFAGGGVEMLRGHGFRGGPEVGDGRVDRSRANVHANYGQGVGHQRDADRRPADGCIAGSGLVELDHGAFPQEMGRQMGQGGG